MITTHKFAPKISSGIDVVDRTWGGLFEGGSYLVYGRVSNGRGLVSLIYSQTGTELGETCIFVSNERAKDLVIQAASVGFDVHGAHRDSSFRLVRASELIRDEVGPNSSSFLAGLVEVVKEFKPSRLVLNDFMSLVRFSSEYTFATFQAEYVRLLEQIEPLGTTLLVVLPEPANDGARQLTEYVMSKSTGAIHVGRAEGEPETYQLTLIPQIGHITRRRKVEWPLHGLVSQAERIEASYKALVERRAEAQLALPQSNRPESASNLAVVPDLPVPTTTETVEATTLDDLARGLGGIDASADDPAPEPADVSPVQTTGEASDPLGQSSSLQPHVRSTDEHTTVGRKHTDRNLFSKTLQHHYDLIEQQGTHFLLVAMRMDPSSGSARPFDFEFLSSVVIETLRKSDFLLVDLAKERLVLLLPNSNADDSQHFFAKVKERLRREAPVQANHLLQLVSAIVVPNGNPFEDADRFLSYVLDSN